MLRSVTEGSFFKKQPKHLTEKQVRLVVMNAHQASTGKDGKDACGAA